MQTKSKLVLGSWILITLVFSMVGFSKVMANPCDEDVDKFCGNNQPGMGDVGSCIDSKLNDFSYPCREWIKKVDHSLRQLKDACSWPARDYCRDVKPGYQRVKNCLMNNFDKLPPGCQEALKTHGGI